MVFVGYRVHVYECERAKRCPRTEQARNEPEIAIVTEESVESRTLVFPSTTFDRSVVGHVECSIRSIRSSHGVKGTHN